MNRSTGSTERTPQILVVDDDPTAVMLLGRILDGTGEIIFALEAQEAMRCIRATPPDLILLDAEMAGTDGFAMCEQLKADPATCELPIIFVTASDAPEAELRALSIGAVDFIHKPINPPVLLARVNTQLELKRRGDQLRLLSRIDALTSVANRRAFDETLALEWRRMMRQGGDISLLMIDVDHFKAYNDAHGHPAGDDCLRRIATCLSGTVHRAGDLVARYGGEEFAVILPNTAAADAQRIAEHIHTEVARLNIPHGASPAVPHVSLSAGVATLSLPCIDEAPDRHNCEACEVQANCTTGWEPLVMLADKALYAAKGLGRNRVECAVGVLTHGPEAFGKIRALA